MPTGESLALFLGLLAFAGSTAVAAYTMSGAKARNLDRLGRQLARREQSAQVRICRELKIGRASCRERVYLCV